MPGWNEILRELNRSSDMGGMLDARREKYFREINSITGGNVKDVFLNHKNSHSHSRHLSKQDCKNAGLPVVDLENDQRLQDAVLSLHHCYMILFDRFKISKVVENNIGGRFLQNYVSK